MNEKITQQQFLDFMQIHKRPIINVDTMDWLIGQGFFVKPAAINQSIVSTTQAVCLNIP